MTRPRELIGLATGSVRVSVEDLDTKELHQLFREYVQALEGHYSPSNKGGSRFVQWEAENFGENLTQHSIQRFLVEGIDEALWPDTQDYNRSTRIVSLTGHYFRMPEFKEPKGGDWKLGDQKLITRLCVTNVGKVYLEWYEGKIVKMDDVRPTLPVKVLVTSAEYLHVPMYFYDRDMPAQLRLLLLKHPSIIHSFGYGILELIKSEADERDRRTSRDRDQFNKLNMLGRMFGITHP